MRKFLFAGLLFSGTTAFAQLETHTLTITAARQINLQPDQVGFGVYVASSTATSVDQVVAALSGLNITSANLTAISNADASTLQWSFILAVPLSIFTGTIGSLTKLQQSIAQNNSGLTLTFNVNGAQVSAKLQQSQSCSTSVLIPDATAQAQKLANAAGMTIGSILSQSNVSSAQPTPAPADILVVDGAISDFFLETPTPPVTCSLAVKFQLQP